MALVMRVRQAISAGMLVTASTAFTQPAPGPGVSPNVVIFVADGLRSRMVNDETAPNMSTLARQGVYLVNGHALFPTFTTANSSGIATGHQLGDTGVFGNTIFAGYEVASAAKSETPFIENDAVPGDLDAHFSANFVNEETIPELARDKGYSTAAIGKVGPTLMFDHTARTGSDTVIIDDATGNTAGVPLSPQVIDLLKAAGLPAVAPGRGANGKASTPEPAIVVNFRSYDTICGEPVRCAVTVSDSGLQQGQGMHGSFSRADTWNFMALAGPDFKAGFVDPAPGAE